MREIHAHPGETIDAAARRAWSEAYKLRGGVVLIHNDRRVAVNYQDTWPEIVRRWRATPETRETDWQDERTDILVRFLTELTKATGDGSKKRQAGEKPPWFVDGSHERAIFSHLAKWKAGELVDPDSGAHPLVHAAWRCLAIACQQTGNIPDMKESA